MGQPGPITVGPIPLKAILNYLFAIYVYSINVSFSLVLREYIQIPFFLSIYIIRFFSISHQIQLDFISTSILSSESTSWGRRPSRGKGSNELRLQRIIREAKFENSSFVTPKSWVSPAPIKPPKTLPQFDMDMSVANRVASMPFGQILAAKTRTGMNDTWKGSLSFNLLKKGKVEGF